MARFVFFSFDYADVGNFRVNVVRNNWLLKNKQETFVDGSIWENAKSKVETQLKKLIEEGLNRTSVTAVLIGQGTASRRWVNFEIVKSFERGNRILGVYINRIRGKDGFIVSRGGNPLDRLGFKVSDEGKKVNFYELKNGRWISFEDMPQINNKKSNTLYFDDSFWFGNDYGEFYTFSEKFKTYCWDFDAGNKNFIEWVDNAAEDAGR